MLEIQQAFLRRLDEFRVVRPSRSAGGQRRYTRNEITVVQYVVELVGEGMTLAAIRRVLELRGARARTWRHERDALVAAARLAASVISYSALRPQVTSLRSPGARPQSADVPVHVIVLRRPGSAVSATHGPGVDGSMMPSSSQV